MRPFARILMFLACLLYGSMPAQSALDIARQGGGLSFSEMAGMAHDTKGHDAKMASHGAMPDDSPSEAASKNGPCPQREGMKHTPFCAACLMLLPVLVFREAGKTPFSYPKPDLGQTRPTGISAPPVPPPRA